jgi:hypothetical protein
MRNIAHFPRETSDERRQCVALPAQLHASRAERATMEAEHESLCEADLRLIEKGTFYVAQYNHTLTRSYSRSVQRLQPLATRQTCVDKSGQCIFPPLISSLLCRLARPFTMNDSPTQATSPARTATDDVDCGCMCILRCSPLHNS